MGCLELFRDQDPDVVRVEAQSGDVFDVVGGVCTCGASDCTHARAARDYVSKARKMRYLSKSAFHKELRTGNVARAIGFGRICERFRPGEAKRYMRKILTEETRNADLLVEFYKHSPSDWEVLCEMFCRSKKDWQLGWTMGWFSRPWIEVLYKFDGLPVHIEWPADVYGYSKDLIERGDLDRLYELVVCAGVGAGEYKDEKKLLRDAMCDALDKSGHPMAGASIYLRTMYNDELSVVFEMLSGVWKSEANDYAPPFGDYDVPFEVPAFMDYVHDQHTLTGKARMKAVGGQIKAGEPSPKGIDLRLSGADAGTVWRLEAIQKFGTIDVPWEDVMLDSDFAMKVNQVCEKWYRDWDGSPREVAW